MWHRFWRTTCVYEVSGQQQNRGAHTDLLTPEFIFSASRWLIERLKEVNAMPPELAVIASVDLVQILDSRVSEVENAWPRSGQSSPAS